MSLATLFDSDFYLSENIDVMIAVDSGTFATAFDHFLEFGAKEFRAPNFFFSFDYYLSKNLDVADADAAGVFDNAFDHFRLFGEAENRAPSLDYDGFDASSYLDSNEDIKAAFEASLLGSALEHFINFGQFESRPGTKISSNVYTLTRRFDEFEGGLGDDKFLADPLTLDVDDILNGRGGVDTLELSFNSRSWTD